MRHHCPDWLSLFEPETAADLARRSKVRHLVREQILFNEGDPCLRAHYVRDGVVKIGSRSLEGRETIIGLAVPGDLIDPVAILDEGRQPYDAIAAMPSEIVTIEAAPLRRALETSPLACLRLARDLATRTRSVVDTARERSMAGATARVAGRLLELAALMGELEGDGIRVRPALHQGDIARFAGVSRESACKMLARLRRAGVIDYDKKGLRVMRPDVLERLRCAERASTPSR